MAFPDEVIADAELGSSIRDKLNRALDTQGFGDRARFSTTVTQTISDDTWTIVDFDTLDLGSTDMVLNANGSIDIPASMGGLWSMRWAIAWANDAVGLPKHRRRSRYVVSGFPGVYGNEILFDPSMGDLSIPSYQIGFQPASVSAVSTTTHRIEVWHNAGQDVDIVKDSVGACLWDLTRLGD